MLRERERESNYSPPNTKLATYAVHISFPFCTSAATHLSLDATVSGQRRTLHMVAKVDRDPDGAIFAMFMKLFRAFAKEKMMYTKALK